MGRGLSLFLWSALLPKRDSLASLLTDKSRMKFLRGGHSPESNLIGREVTSVQLFKRDGVRLIDVVRKGESLRRNLKGLELCRGSRDPAHADDRIAKLARKQIPAPC